MAIKLYDTLSDKKKPLKPRSDKKIEIFVCGPTVYDYSHIGHARTYIAFDAFVKYLKSQGYQVRYVQNITDLDDKIIARAEELKQSPEDLARDFEKKYDDDMKLLGIHSVDKYARATDYIPQIISQVERLIAKGYGYEIPEEGIYFDIAKFTDYGKLSGRTAEQAEDAVSRIDESVRKRNKGDFVLWKISKPGEPKWKSPWGDGRPGWHIEDTAITETEFGVQYDIHGGARDLLFPHHESEIAQMETLSQKSPLVNYWMHTGFLTVHGEKMSKSLSNFITINEFLRAYSKETFRLFILSSHYRSPIDYSKKAVEQAETNTSKLGIFRQRLEQFVETGAYESSGYGKKLLRTHRDNFEKNLEDDFNTPRAFSELFELTREINKLIDEKTISTSEIKDVLKFVDHVNNIFGIVPILEQLSIPEKIKDLGDDREKLRKEGKWKDADKIRKKIEEAGYSLKDTPQGPQIKKRT